MLGFAMETPKQISNSRVEFLRILRHITQDLAAAGRPASKCPGTQLVLQGEEQWVPLYEQTGDKLG
jgi:hypothetical protein